MIGIKKNLLLINLFILLFITSSVNYKKGNADNVQLSNNLSNKSISLNKNLTLNKITKVFGKPIKIVKENSDENEDDEQSWVEIYYSGLKISLIGNNLEELEINNRDWRVNELSIGDKIAKVNSIYKKINKYRNEYIFYSLGDFDGVLYLKQNSSKQIIFIGVGSNP